MRPGRFRSEIALIVLALTLLALLQAMAVFMLARGRQRDQLRARQMVLAGQVIPQLNPELSQGLIGGHLGVRFNSLKESYPGLEPYVVDVQGRILFYVHSPELLKRERLPVRGIEAFLDHLDKRLLPQAVLECEDPRSKFGTLPCSLSRISFGKRPAVLMLLLEPDWAQREVERGYFFQTIGALLAISLSVFLLLGTVLSWLLNRRQREVERALAEISHDLRSPLASLISYLQALVQRHTTMNGDEIGRYLGTALRSARSVDDLNHEILELSSLSIGGRYQNREIISLDELLIDVLARFRERSDRQRAEFETEMVKETLLVEGSPRLLERLFANLLENALRHSGGGKIWLRVETASNWIKVSVANTIIPGARVSGWKLWMHSRFGFFESADGQRGSLGLTIVRKIAEAHGGWFGLKNGAIGTVEATVQLPRHSVARSTQV